jgi:hypothetical protein
MDLPKEIFIYEFDYVEESHLGKMWHEGPSEEGNKSHKYISAQELIGFAHRMGLEIKAEGDFLLGYLNAMADLTEKVR